MIEKKILIEKLMALTFAGLTIFYTIYAILPFAITLYYLYKLMYISEYMRIEVKTDKIIKLLKIDYTLTPIAFLLLIFLLGVNNHLEPVNNLFYSPLLLIIIALIYIDLYRKKLIKKSTKTR
ncbi:hypothetical protein [Gemella sp. zg-1178]|uniref:hypothetical protein n=1 Tax=Gemella sp. zg-1178 TaxID=2840372 RepID=UPI001C043058|nr:hypothetical protein [Gemella sp. zg-1178]MBU0279154.1 hypothetical protein [Gemella sp. zg-1178]